jgi:hypothetical protein
MRSIILFFIPLLLLASLSCASRSPHAGGEPDLMPPSATEAHLSAYDRLEGRFHTLSGIHQERYGRDPLFIEAEAMASAAEELYLLAEYHEALEILQQAVDLLEERHRGEETHR